MKILNIENIKKVGLVAKIDNEFCANLSILKRILAKYDVEILFEQNTAKSLDIDGLEIERLAKKADLLICLGGDGTIISVCRKTAEISPFIIGIHAGRLGFLTETNIDECELFFDEFFAGNFIVEEPYVLDVLLNKGGKITTKIATNDAVIMRAKPVSIARVEAFFDGKYFNTYFGDGVIASTPLGSTAYNMSANGAIIYPLSNVFSLTPICSHSLTQRPLILPQSFCVEFKASGDEILVIDGQESIKMSSLTSVIVRLSQKRVRLVRHSSRNYFQILKNKLHWGYND